MDAPVLDPEELAALRSALAPRATRPTTTAPDVDAQPVALIEDDRAAERARPEGMRIGQRLATGARELVFRTSGARVEIESTVAEILDGATAREQLEEAWLGAGELAGRDDLIVMALSGPMVEGLAMRLLSRSAEVPTTERPISPAVRRLFTPVGNAMLGALAVTFAEQQGRKLSQPVDGARVDTWRRALTQADLIVCISIVTTAPLPGRIRVYARPETLVPPPPPPKLIPAPRGAIEAVLGNTPVPVLVELGTVRMSMSELLALKPGTIIPLHQPVEGLVPVRCGGLIKAHGRPIVSRGAIAVEIVDPATEEQHEKAALADHENKR